LGKNEIKAGRGIGETWGSNNVQLAVILSLCTLEGFPDLLAEFKGSRKEEYREGNG